MSFLSGILSFGKSAVSFLSGSSLSSTLVKTVLAGYALSKFSSSLKENGGGPNNIDKGVRLQIAPASENKIPVLYGTAYFGGIISDAEMSADNKTMYYCLTLAEKTGTDLSSNPSTYVFKDVYWNDQRIVFQNDGITADYTVDRNGNFDRSISGLVKVYCYAGNSSSGQVPENYTGSVPNADTIMPDWAALTHPMTDLIFAVVQVSYNRDKNITGIGDMLFQIENSLKYPGDVITDYLTNTTYGAGIASSDVADLTALNTYAQTTVSYTDEGTGAATLDDRYQINGVIDTSENVITNLENLCSAAGSWLSYDITTGSWDVIINKTDTSAQSFDDSNIIGNISVSGTGFKDLYNSVKVEFPHRDLRDSGDFVKIEIPSVDRNANELDNTLNITYDIINEPVQAEVLGLIELKQSRVDLLINFTTDYTNINLQPGNVIDITNSRLGFTNKEFRILSINEKSDQQGSLTIEITALEYDANVYSTADITRFTRSDENGIVAIGDIGQPGTPQVTKFEIDSRPRVLIETTAPTGVVDGIEYWVTYDTAEPDDDLRSYSLLATERPVGGGVFTSGTTVTLDYDALGDTEFRVKTRGINTTTSGPFSEVSGLVDYTPQQQTDAIGPDTAVLDGLGNLLTAVAAFELLGLVDDLYSKTTPDGTGLFDKIFEVFEDVTGYDLVGEAEGGNLVVATDLEIQDDGTQIATAVSTINFVGASVAATSDGNIITVSHTDTTSDPATVIVDPDGTTQEDLDNLGIESVALVSDNKLPADRDTFADPITGFSTDQAPATGSYFMRFVKNTGKPLYSNLSTGSGNVFLYKSNGTLVETVPAASCLVSGNVLEIPFANRDLGTDYYILMDEGVVEYCDYLSAEIADPLTWNFNTPFYTDATAFTGIASTLTNLEVVSVSYETCQRGDITITFDGLVTAGTGSILVKKFSDDTTVGTVSVSGATADGTTLVIADPGLSLEPSTSYYIEVPNGIGNVNDGCSTAPNLAYTSGPFTTEGTLELTQVLVNTEVPGDRDTASPETNIRLVFNQPVAVGFSGNIYIGSHQTIDVAQTFDTNYSSELIWASGNTIYLNPTEDFTLGDAIAITSDANTVQTDCGIKWDGTIPGFVDNTFIVDPGPTADEPVFDEGQVNKNGVVMNFDRTVIPGTGTFKVVDNNDVVIATVSADDPEVTIEEV